MMPHQGQPLLTAGKPLAEAKAAMIMIHGRGASAHDILTLTPELQQSEFAYLAPQAAGHTWYPYSFLMPIPQNEPGISSGMTVVEGLVEQVIQVGIPAEKIMLLGFSQGACLTLEYTARHARRYGGVIGFSGGLIGPDGTPRDYAGSLSGTPIFLGCSDIDPHIPKERVLHSAEVLRTLGGEVTDRLYAGMGHTVNADELNFARAMMQSVLAG